MRGASRTSLAAVTGGVEAVAAPATGAADPAELAAALREVVHLLDREHTLRRVLSDPAQSPDQKSGLVRSLLAGRIDDTALDLVDQAVRARWSRIRDLPDALEHAAVSAEVIGAERAGDLDDLEDELFRFRRIVEGQPELRTALSDPGVSPDRKSGLLEELLEGKVTAVSLRLIREVVTHPRGRSLNAGLEDYGRVAAERRQRLVAVVRTAVPLGEDRRRRLAAALEAMYGHEVHLNIEVDTDVVGGLSVQVGDELIDGTIAGRLGEVQRRLEAS